MQDINIPTQTVFLNSTDVGTQCGPPIKVRITQKVKIDKLVSPLGKEQNFTKTFPQGKTEDTKGNSNKYIVFPIKVNEKLKERYRSVKLQYKRKITQNCSNSKIDSSLLFSKPLKTDISASFRLSKSSRAKKITQTSKSFKNYYQISSLIHTDFLLPRSQKKLVNKYCKYSNLTHKSPFQVNSYILKHSNHSLTLRESYRTNSNENETKYVKRIANKLN